MEQFELEMYEGYPLVKLKEGIFLIDTGSPSFSLTSSVLSIKIDGRGIAIPYQPFVSDETMNFSFGRRIQGFLGKEILQSFSAVTVDKKNKRVIFNDTNRHEGNVIPMNRNFLYPCSVNSIDSKGYLDTGAHAVMIKNKEVVNGCKYLGMVKEGLIGTSIHELEMYEVKFSFMGKEITAKGLLIPSYYPYDYFFSIDLFAEEYYCFDFMNGKIWYK